MIGTDKAKQKKTDSEPHRSKSTSKYVKMDDTEEIESMQEKQSFDLFKKRSIKYSKIDDDSPETDYQKMAGVDVFNVKIFEKNMLQFNWNYRKIIFNIAFFGCLDTLFFIVGLLGPPAIRWHSWKRCFDILKFERHRYILFIFLCFFCFLFYLPFFLFLFLFCVCSYVYS